MLGQALTNIIVCLKISQKLHTQARTVSRPLYSLHPSSSVLYVRLYISQKINNNYHFSDHLTNLSRSLCKCCLSPSLLTFLNTFVSSANFSMLLVILSSKSLIYIKNNKGPKFISSLKPHHLLRYAVFCQPVIVLTSRLCHHRCHGLLIKVIVDVALCQKLSDNLRMQYLLVIIRLST